MYNNATATKEYLKSINTKFLQLVSNSISVNIDEKNDPEKLCSICLAVEQIYFVRNFRFVGPVSFSKGLEKSLFSECKACHALDSSTMPCRSITV